MKLKILSYNIHKGFTALNRDFILERIRSALRETDADVLLLQEVLGFRDEKYHLSEEEVTIQFEYLADSFWTHFAYGKNAVYTKGHHGNAILSKYPIAAWSNLTLSSGKAEPRGMLKARIYIPEIDRQVILANTHLGLSQKGRNEETDVLVEDLRGDDGLPWILVGDFNDWNGKVSPQIEDKLNAQEAFKTLHGKYPPTFPSLLPFLSLDRVFLHNMTAVKAEVLLHAPWKSLSDHLPLYVEVDLGAA